MNIDAINKEIAKINEYMRKCLWMDFEICKMSGLHTVVSGRIDRSYNEWAIDIEFSYPYCITGPFFFTADNTKELISIAGESEFIEINKKYHIEEGCYLFRINTGDYYNDAFYIAAKGIKCIIHISDPIS